MGGLLWVNAVPPLDPPVGRAAGEVGESRRPPRSMPPAALAVLASVAALTVLTPDATFSVLAPAAAPPPFIPSSSP
jgi:hypothetical protein